MRRGRGLRDQAPWLVLLGILSVGCAADEDTQTSDEADTVEDDQGSSDLRRRKPRLCGRGWSPWCKRDAGPGTKPDAGPETPDAGPGEQTEPTVTIESGALRGETEGSTHRFLGIPYAKPPVGDLRWKTAKKPEAWSGVRDAKQFGKRCAQLESKVLQNPASEDEDCLYLNVWTPALTPKEPLPVMFWIHGGGNVNGSASELVPYATEGYFYDGRHLAEKGVVVVTFNYRLGVFGFFAPEGLGAEGENFGNQGLLDQVAALEWVKANIAKFGGDPSNVTIFGESAGSFDVCAHVASAKSRPLFHKAISQSGGCTTLQKTKQAAVTQASDLATKLGCTGVAADVLACLRDKPVADLLAQGTGFNPIVDGVFFTDQPRVLFDRGDIAKVPYLLGSNTDEGTLFVATPISTAEQYTASLTATFGQARVAAISALYAPEKFADAKPNPYHAAFARALGDSRLVCSTFDAAVRAQKAGSSVYMYNFDIPSPVGDQGATHGAELVYVFGTSRMATPESKAASELIQRYWTRFAKSGEPNGPEDQDPTWPAFTSSENVRMNLAYTPAVVRDFRAAECAFWQKGYDAQFAPPTAPAAPPAAP